MWVRAQASFLTRTADHLSRGRLSAGSCSGGFWLVGFLAAAASGMHRQVHGFGGGEPSGGRYRAPILRILNS